MGRDTASSQMEDGARARPEADDEHGLPDWDVTNLSSEVGCIDLYLAVASRRSVLTLRDA